MFSKIFIIICCVCATGICALVIISVCELVKWLSEAKFQCKYPKYTLALKEYEYALHRMQSYKIDILNPLCNNVITVENLSTDVFTEKAKQELLTAYKQQQKYCFEVYKDLAKKAEEAENKMLDLRKLYGKRA